MIETPEQRSERMTAVRTERGNRLYIQATSTCSADWLYHRDARAKLHSSEAAEFDLEFIKARAVAGVRPSVDLALAAMRAKLSQRLGAPTWRAK
jgi:hypothetical protein